MLTIVTGLPGACKTLYTLSKIFKLYKDRQIYVHNIDGIDHDHFGSLSLDDPEKWYELPTGAVVVIDEAQGIFPLRKVGAGVPVKCSKFETHRHDGFDVVLITQDATLLDVHIRKLAGKHFHCKRLFGSQSSTIFEYNKWEVKPEDRNTIGKAISKEVWGFDKSIYPYYKSAEVHTVKRKLPFKLVVLPFLAVAIILTLYWSVSTVMAMFEQDAETVTEILEGGGEKTETVVHLVADPLELWIQARTPLVEGLPWTAPIYDEIYEVKTFPKPSCIIHGVTGDNGHGSCTCYSQQITKMPSVNDAVCRSLAQEGWFDPTREDLKARGGSGSPNRAPRLTSEGDLPALTRDRSGPPVARQRGITDFSVSVPAANRR